MGAKDIISLNLFSDFLLTDPFFDSLINDYSDFKTWFAKKSQKGDKAYTLRSDGLLQGFMYIKVEDGLEPINMTNGQVFQGIPRFKIGTFKIDSHGTILGDRFLAFALRNMLLSTSFKADQAYVTVFPKYDAIFKLFKRFGFEDMGEIIGKNGEHLLLKNLYRVTEDAFKNFPRVDLRGHHFYNLAIRADFHDEFFPEGRLSTDKQIISDNTTSNTIIKTYLTNMRGIDSLQKGDLLTIYRTGSSSGAPANYTSVITGTATVLEYCNMNSFSDYENFAQYIGKGSIFSEKQLQKFWMDKSYVHILKFLYNFSFPKKPNLEYLRNNIFENNRDPEYHGFYSHTKDQYKKILIDGGHVDERFIIDQT